MKPLRDNGWSHRALAGAPKLRRALALAAIALLSLVGLLVAQMTVAADADDAVGGLVLSSDEPGVLVISWDAHDPLPTDYRVNWSETGEDFPSHREDDGNAYPTTNAQTLSGLEPGVEYEVRVRARYLDRDAWLSSSAWSETARLTVAAEPAPDDSLTTNVPGQDSPASDSETGNGQPTAPQSPDLEPPGQPQGLQVVVSHDMVRLSWDDPGDATISGYQILRRLRDHSPVGVFEVLIEDTGSAASSYVDREVQPETRYNYRIKARNAAGLSERSNFVRADTPAVPDLGDSGAPSDLTAEVAAVGGVALRWQAPAADAETVTGYRLLRAVANSAMSILDADTGPDTTSYFDSSATTPGETYRYQVLAVRGEQAGQSSDTVTVSVPQSLIADQQNTVAADRTVPGNLVATFRDDHISLEWTTPEQDGDSVTGYQILRTDGGSWSALTADTHSVATTYDDREITPGETYFYAVKAWRGIELSERSEPDLATAEPCDADAFNLTPVDVPVSVTPIVVESTAADYFVLFVRPDLNEALEIPISVTLGADGTTTLTEQLSPLPIAHYRVEKYPVDDPADTDGDCISDIAELADLGALNPLNRAREIEVADGAVAIPDRDTFERLSYQGVNVSVDGHLRGLEFVKFFVTTIIADRPAAYFMNTVTYRAHFQFENAVPFGWVYMKGEIVYHPNVIAPDGSLGVYRFEFEPWDDYPFNAVQYAYEVLAASMPVLERNFAYYPMPRFALPRYLREQAQYDDSRVTVLLESDIFPDVDFISLNQSIGYGILREVEPEDRPNPREIVIYESLPNDLPRVAGIITTVPQTPLSHVNLRAIQDRIPNAFIRDALDEESIDSLIDTHVRYEVTGSGYTIRAATKAEVDAHHDASRPTETQTPERDLTVTEITALSDVSFDDWTAFGVKAANLAVLGSLGFPDGAVPDGYAVPFYFYDEFMKANDLYTDIADMLADTDFQTDFDTQDNELKKLRKKIKDATTPDWIITALEHMHDQFPEGTSLRYRSSTNNEDLPGFSGAGLYDSKTQDPDETEDDGIDKSIKGVWASLWNFRAFVERDFHRIDHNATAMGVLVHPNYSDELANGVAVSYDPFSHREAAYYLNTQIGEDLVTNPEAKSVPEALLLLPGGSYEVLVRSNQVGVDELLMSDTQLQQLRSRLSTIHDHFKTLYEPAEDERFAMEIEYKITSDNVLAIKQARPWVFRPVNESPTFPATETGVRTIAEGTPRGTDIGSPVAATDPEGDMVTYSLGGLHVDQFRIDSTSGQLRTWADLDYEDVNTYAVDVTAGDAANREGATITVQIVLTNEDEGGAIELRPPLWPLVGTPLTATLTDPDGRITSQSWSWHRSPNGSSWTLIANAAAATYTPVAADINHYLQVTVRYTDHHGSGKEEEQVSHYRTATPYPDVTVSFAQLDYSVAEGDAVEVTVELSADPERTVVIPITVTAKDGASPDDYSVVPTSVTFNADAERSKTITFSAVDDMVDDDGEGVTLGFDLGNVDQVFAGSTPTTTVAIDDDDHPQVNVSFAESSYSVAEGDAVEVTVELSADPERTVVIPITVTAKDGASPDDYSVVPTSVTFNADAERSKTITFSAVDDMVDDDGEGVTLGFDLGNVDQVFAGSTPTTTVAIDDDDHPQVNVSFAESSYSVAEGDAVEVTVELSADPERTVVIPITVTAKDGASPGDYSVVPTSVTFNADAERSKTITFSAVDDMVDDDGEGVTLGFDLGNVDQVFAGSTPTTTVAIDDDDHPQVNVSFAQLDYSVAEGDAVEVTVELSADPERTVVIPITVTAKDGASPDDYSVVPTSVTFNADAERSKTITFSAVDDMVDDDGESVELGFGPLPDLVSAVGNTTAIVSIDDNDGRGVTVSKPELSIAEGESATYTIVLGSAPTGEVLVTVEAPAGSDFSVDPPSLSFTNTNWSAPREVTVSVAQDDDSADDTGTITHTVSGADYAGVTARSIIVKSIDGEEPQVAVSFERASYSVSEGDSVTINVTLDRDPERSVIVRIDTEHYGGVSDGDYSQLPERIAFASGETEQSFGFGALEDDEADGGEQVLLSLDAMPQGVSAGATDEAMITITEQSTSQNTGSGSGSGSGGGGGGGGPPPVPIPSDEDFDWNVTRDIETLDDDNDLPTDTWSDGKTLWVVENSASGADRVFAYDLQTGERQPDAEFELDRRNRFSHGIWSDGTTIWVADSGQDQLFAYNLASGERLEERDIELAERNRDPRGIWSDGKTLFVLDSVKDGLFVYDFETGELLAEHPLDKLNKSPRGIWSDGVAIWVSDDGAKRLFAYEFEDESLVRNEDLEFTFRSLLKAGNGDARGIWSDGEIMYVADEQDAKVYSYNIPDAIVARLSSLTLSELEIGAFSPARLDYSASAEFDQTATSVAAEATTEVATVVVQPSDTDTDSDPENGHQVDLGTETPITITVTSGDGSRTTTYRVLVSRPSCLDGLTEESLSEVTFASGSVSELETCAQSLDLSAFYHQVDGVWTAFFLDAPEFLNRPFRDRFAAGLPPGETLIAKRQPVAEVDPAIAGSP